ncbi:hypothetical protein CVT26_009148 [Gymnopilus dilepis]|uniref:F-box domain-containing protein n=1 Tax=Gymnopilus dilepis TaxID=231916 RepID=A0A409Y998_9AGAR|nr:hypothetical protein CVT26_009148 [Gymnopilus dilepis]
MSQSILKLNHDVLWLILLDITEFRELSPCWPHQKGPSPLKNLLHVSQVCASWRAFTLASSMLWGRVIDINMLYRLAETGRAEILQRTSGSNLHAQAVVCRDGGLQAFSKTLLMNEWRRVQSLDLMFTIGLKSHQEFEDWLIFQTPAPKLKHLYLDCTPPSRHTFANTFELFSNHAPELRSFSCSSLRISTGASWFSDLRDLRFTSSFTALELLSILQQMPSLENLQVYADTSDGDVHSVGVTHLPLVMLPRLKHIAFHTIYRRDSVPKYLDVLAHIVPPDGCVLFLPNLHIEPVQSDLKAAYNILRSYFRAFLRRLTGPLNMTMNAERNSFQLFSGNFGFDLSCSRGFPNPALFLEALSSSEPGESNKLSILTDAMSTGSGPIQIISSLPSFNPTDPDSLKWSIENIPLHVSVQAHSRRSCVSRQTY